MWSLPFSFHNEPKRTPCCAFLAYRVRSCCVQQPSQPGQKLCKMWRPGDRANPPTAECMHPLPPLWPPLLKAQMDPPMSDWFRSLPHAIDSIANAVKFQQQSLATLVHHYRRQCLQLSATCDRLRSERRELRGYVRSLSSIPLMSGFW